MDWTLSAWLAFGGVGIVLFLCDCDRRQWRARAREVERSLSAAEFCGENYRRLEEHHKKLEADYKQRIEKAQKLIFKAKVTLDGMDYEPVGRKEGE